MVSGDLTTASVFPFADDLVRCQAGSFPWLAADPISGQFYSSRFADDGTRTIFVYDVNFRYVRSLRLSRAVSKVQGGAVLPTGHLVLSSDKTHDLNVSRLADGVFVASIPVDVHSSKEKKWRVCATRTWPSTAYARSFTLCYSTKTRLYSLLVATEATISTSNTSNFGDAGVHTD